MPDIGRWGVVDPLVEMYIDVTPYNYVGNNPVILIDPDGMEIVNGAEVKRKEAEQRSNSLNNAVKVTEEKYGTKKSDYSSKEKFKKYKDLKKSARKAKRSLNKWTREAKNTQNMIDDFKSNSPNMFKKLNNLENEQGEEVDVYFVSTNNVEGPNDGANIFGFVVDE